ncbi:MAG: HAD family phosphatase [Cyanobacteria bacterium SZAS-4]|nr:HAD family phosphatase [Cyanobacteria bacterium SZAS-4]
MSASTQIHSLSTTETEQLRDAVAKVAKANYEQIVWCAKQSIMSVPRLLKLLAIAEKLEAILHDLDNNLAKTEVVAFEACALVVNKLGKRKGLNLQFTGETLMATFLGMNFKGMAMRLQKQYGFELTESEIMHYVSLEKRMVMLNFRRRGIEATEGSRNFLLAARACGIVQAIVSSSAMQRIDLTVDLLGIGDIIPECMRFSAAAWGVSKPDKLPYVKTTEILHLDPALCAATEDAWNGTKSAHDARIGYVLGYSGSVPAEKAEAQAIELMNNGADEVASHWDNMVDVLYDLVYPQSA